MQSERKMPIDEVLSRLDNVLTSGEESSARCPAHADWNNSLTVNEDDDGTMLLYCHAGCTFDEIAKALDMKQSEFFPSAQTQQEHQRNAGGNGAAPRKTANRKPASDPPAKVSVIAKPKLVTANGSKDDWAALTKQYEDECNDDLVKMLADELGVSPDALRRLHVGWKDDEQCYTFPEMSAKGEIVGINRRNANDGNKKAIKGSKRGLTLPEGWADGDGPLLIPEGASDAAAALTMGLAVVGRPSAMGGVKSLIPLLRSFPVDRDIIVVGEMDAKDDGRWPGCRRETGR